VSGAKVVFQEQSERWPEVGGLVFSQVVYCARVTSVLSTQ
jgi:hypothetical protein